MVTRFLFPSLVSFMCGLPAPLLQWPSVLPQGPDLGLRYRY